VYLYYIVDIASVGTEKTSTVVTVSSQSASVECRQNWCVILLSILDDFWCV